MLGEWVTAFWPSKDEWFVLESGTSGKPASTSWGGEENKKPKYLNLENYFRVWLPQAPTIMPQRFPAASQMENGTTHYLQLFFHPKGWVIAGSLEGLTHSPAWSQQNIQDIEWAASNPTEFHCQIVPPLPRRSVMKLIRCSFIHEKSFALSLAECQGTLTDQVSSAEGRAGALCFYFISGVGSRESPWRMLLPGQAVKGSLSRKVGHRWKKKDTLGFISADCFGCQTLTL